MHNKLRPDTHTKPHFHDHEAPAQIAPINKRYPSIAAYMEFELPCSALIFARARAMSSAVSNAGETPPPPAAPEVAPGLGLVFALALGREAGVTCHVGGAKPLGSIGRPARRGSARLVTKLDSVKFWSVAEGWYDDLNISAVGRGPPPPMPLTPMPMPIPNPRFMPIEDGRRVALANADANPPWYCTGGFAGSRGASAGAF